MQKANFVLYMISFALGWIGAWIIAKWGMKLSLLDEPNSRSSHIAVTPKGGGIGVLAAFLVSSIILSIPKSFWIPGTFLSLFSLWGDHSEIKPAVRLFIQFTAGTILLIGILSEMQTGITSYALMPLFLIFVVGTSNFYNFMDGINGIAGITGIVGFGLTAFYALNHINNLHLSILATCMSISCLGFLPYNIPKARVFMGDVGSILIGFVFSGMVVYLSNDVLDFICLSSFLSLFYADELTTIITRLKSGENLITAHRHHIYQLLANECKIPHWKISVGYGFFQLVIGLSIIWAKNMGFIMMISVLTFFICSFMIFSIILRKKIRLVA